MSEPSRTIRELSAGEVALAAPALLLLRPHFADEVSLLAAVERQRAQGYRLLAAFVPGVGHAVAVAGFRIVEYLAWGKALYLDDFSALEAHRGGGHAYALMRRLEEIARAEGCGQFHLDSGFGSQRAAAHTLYYRCSLYPTSLHFSKELSPAG